MGNYIASCTCGISPATKTTKSTRVVFPTGEIHHFQDSINAAEIMLDCPNFFLVNSHSLTINKRFSPLSADDNLHPGNVYIMFPMRRVNSMVTPGDMVVFWLLANNGTKRITGRISPETESGGEAELPRLVADSDVDVPEFGHRLMVSRSKKPGLDTITEEPVRCK
ncbi:hypothetical protein QVD17_31873 [Tagetes erecta]|uniref:Uncharacterized protein n=1 Tax=Tagetes erecta TaxID=13708 RepID=A0AAD8NHG5_TARER|nr:hypothetical protein QVD17_31873 [Tagetes erecta]